MQGTPDWITPIATISVVLAVLSALAIAYDVYARGYRQPIGSMGPVWVISALWLSIFAIPLYVRVGRPRSQKWQKEHPDAQRLGFAATSASGGLPGGAASLVGHVIGIPLVLATGWTILGVDMFAMIAVILVLVIMMLFAFEYQVNNQTGSARAAGMALGAAVATGLAFDVGMGAWMLVLHFNHLLPPLTSVNFLFLMQIGIILGFLTALPAVRYLLKRRLKQAV